MITEGMLKQAAEKANEAIIESIPLDAGKEHIFSKKYERKMKRLMSKTKHPLFYAGTRRVAGFILILLLGGTILLVTNTDARAKVMEWIKIKTENLMIYRFEGEESNQGTIPEFELGYVPDGYVFYSSYSDENHGFKTFVNEQGNLLNVLCANENNSTVLGVVTNDYTIEYVNIHKYIAEIYIPENENQAIEIVWNDESLQVLFSVSGTFSIDELVKIAVNILIK